MIENINYYQFSRSEMLPFVPLEAKKILEVGCGDGIFLGELAKRQNAEVWGVELDSNAAMKAKSKTEKIFNLSIEDAINQLPKNYFDCIIFNDVLEHLSDPNKVLKLMHQLLAHQGCVVVSIPNVRFLPQIYHYIIQKDWKYDPNGGILDITHLRFFTKKSIIRMFDETGYSIEKIEGINPIELFKYKILINMSLGFLEDTRFMQYACVVRNSSDK